MDFPFEWFFLGAIAVCKDEISQENKPYIL